MAQKHEKKKWSHYVKAVSTFPPAGLFKKDAHTVAQAKRILQEKAKAQEK